MESAVLPGRTAKVVEARAKIAEAHTRRAHAEYLRSAYDAAKVWDRNRARNSQAVGPVTETSADRYTTLVNYRDLDRNTSWLHGVMNSITNNVIGTGIRLEAQVKKKRKDSRLPRGPGGIQLDAYQNEQIEVECILIKMFGPAAGVAVGALASGLAPALVQVLRETAGEGEAFDLASWANSTPQTHGSKARGRV